FSGDWPRIDGKPGAAILAATEFLMKFLRLTFTVPSFGGVPPRARYYNASNLQCGQPGGSRVVAQLPLLKLRFVEQKKRKIENRILRYAANSFRSSKRGSTMKYDAIVIGSGQGGNP